MVNYFGIYFGNSTASIAQYREDGKVEILANEAGERVTPAAVTLSSKEQVVGSLAGITSYSLAPLTIRNNKILLDDTISDEQLAQAKSMSQVKIEGNKDDLSYSVFETEKKPLIYTPVQVATLIFKKLFGIGSGAAPGHKKLNCVICVPKHWSEESRTKLEEAATEAGWIVMQLINEPPSALLAYKIGFEKPPVDIVAVVYRLGGISCDATVIRVEGGFQTILSHVRNEINGGKDIIASLTNHLADEFRRKYRLDPNESRKSMWKLKIAAGNILHTLSTLPSCARFIESVCEGVDFNVTVSRARIDALISPLLPQFTSPITEALTQANIQCNQISKVILTGGVLKIPKLKSSVGSMFSCDVCSSFNPDEVYAIGAAQQAGLIAGLPEGVTVSESSADIPFLTNPIEIKAKDKVLTIEKSALPTFHEMSIKINEPKLTVEATQLSETNPLKGETTISFDEVPEEIELNIKTTMDGELHLEAVNSKNKHVVKSILSFQR